MAFLIDDIFKAIGKKKQLKGQVEEEKKYNELQGKRFGEDEANRAARLGGINKFLSAYSGPGGSSGVSMPGYAIDPETMAQLQKARTFVPAGPNTTTKGAGWQMAGDIAKGFGDSVMNAYKVYSGLGGLSGGGTSGSPVSSLDTMVGSPSAG